MNLINMHMFVFDIQFMIRTDHKVWCIRFDKKNMPQLDA